MGSKLKKKLSQLCAITLSICMVLALNPASALAQTDGAITPLTDEPAQEESGAGVSTEAAPLTMNADGTATAQSTIKLKIVDGTQIKDTTAYPTDAYTTDNVKDVTLQASLTGAAANEAFYFEWLRASHATSSSAAFEDSDYQPVTETTVTGQADKDGNLTISHAFAADAFADENDYQYKLNVYRGSVAPAQGAKADYSLTFELISISDKYAWANIKDIDTGNNTVDVRVLKLKTATGTAETLTDLTGLTAIAVKDKLAVIDKTAFTISVGANSETTDLPSYKQVSSLKLYIPDEYKDKSELFIIGSMEGQSGTFGPVSVAPVEENGRFYVEVSGDDAPEALGSFAVAYETDEAKYKVDVNTTGQGSVALSGEGSAADGFTSGTDVTVKPTPADGYIVSSVTATCNGDPVSLTEAGGQYTFTIQGQTTVNVEFVRASEDTTHSLSVSVDPDSIAGFAPTVTDENGTTYSLSNSHSIKEGTEITITFNLGSSSNSVELYDGTTKIDLPNQTAYTFTLQKDTSLSVKYIAGGAPVPQTVEITLKSNGNGALELGQEGDVQKWVSGTPMVLNVKPNSGYKLGSITYDDGTGKKDASAWLNSQRTQLNVPGAHTVTDLTIEATFVADSVYVTLATSDNTAKGGQVSASAGATTKTGIGSHEFTYGDSVSVNAKPNAGYTLSSIVVKRGDVETTYTADGTNKFTEGSDGTCSVALGALQESVTATATFTPVSPVLNECVITVVTEGDGSVNGDSVVRVTKGQPFTFAFTPSGNSKSADVYLGSSTTAAATNVTSYTVEGTSTNVDALTLRVVFKADTPSGGDVETTYTINASAGEGGTISPSGPVTLKTNQQQSFAITADSGYTIASVLVDGVEQTDAAGKQTYSLTLSNAATVVASFKKNAETSEDYYTLTVNEATHGKVTPPGVQRLAAGSIQTLVFEAEDGYELSSVKVNGAERKADVAQGVLTLSITQDTTVVAEFSAKQTSGDTPIDPVKKSAKVISTFTKGGSISPLGERTVFLDTEGMFVTYAMTPEAGYKLSYLEVEGASSIPADSAHMTKSGNTWTATLKVSDLNWKDGETYTVRAVYTEDQAKPQDVYFDVTTKVIGGNGTISPDADRMLQGTSQTFSFIASSGYKLDEVLVNGAHVQVTNSSYTLTNIQAKTLIEARFVQKGAGDVTPDPQTYTVTAAAPTNGTITPAGATKVVAGSSLAYTIEPANGYAIDTVTVDGAAVTDQMNGSTYQFQNITANHTISATFKQVSSVADDYFVVTASSAGNGSISPVGGIRVVSGKNVPFTFAPNSGYDLEKVVITRGESTTEVPKAQIPNYSYVLNNVIADTSVVAHFKKLEQGQEQPTLPPVCKIAATANAGGMVSPQSMEAVIGSTPTFTFTADAGYHLASVTVDGTVVSVGSDGTLTLPAITAAQAAAGIKIAATFERDATAEIEYRNVTASVVDAGSVAIRPADAADVEGGTGQISPAGTLRVANGGTQTFSFIPDEGCEVYYIQVGNAAPIYTSVSSYTFFSVTTDLDVKVAFKKYKEGSDKQPETPVLKTYEIESSATPGGTVYPAGKTSVVAGASASYTFAAQAGYVLSYIVVDGATVPASSLANKQYVFRDVTANHTVQAVFAEETQQPTSFVEITAQAVGGGAIDPAGAVYVERGKSAEFNVLPQYGYKVKSISVAGKDVSAVSGASYNASTGKLTVPANAQGGVSFSVVVQFEKTASEQPVQEFAKITTAAGTGGTLSPTELTLVKNERASVSVIPDTGKDIDEVVIIYPAGASKSTLRSMYPAPATISTAEDGTARVVVPASKVKADNFTVSVLGVNGASVRATFKDAQGAVNVPTMYTVSGVAKGEGYVTPATQSIPSGGEALVHFVAKNGHELADVKVISGGSAKDVTGSVSSNGFKLDKVDKDAVVVATFKEQPKDDPDYTGDVIHTITIPPTLPIEGGGTVSLYPSGQVEVVEGEDIPITVVSPDGTVVDKIVIELEDGTKIEVPVSGGVAIIPGTDGNGNPIKPGDIASITIPSEADGGTHKDPGAKPVETFKVAASVSRGEGKVTPVNTQVAKGGSVQFVFTPDEGYKVAEVTLNGETVATDGLSYTASGVSKDINLAVAFERDDYLSVISVKHTNGKGVVFYETPLVKNGTKYMRYVVVPESGKEVESATLSSLSYNGAVVIEGENIPVDDFMGEDAERAKRPEYYRAAPISGDVLGQVMYVKDLTHERGDIYQLELKYKQSDRNFAGSSESYTSTLSISAVAGSAGGVGRSTVRPYLADSAKVLAGVPVPIEPVADVQNDFEFVKLIVNGEDVTSKMVGGKYNLVPAAGETYSVQAVFAKENTVGQINVAAQAEGPGTVSPETQQVAKGGTAQFSLIPDKDNSGKIAAKVVGVAINGGARVDLPANTSTYRLPNIQADTSVVFYFEKLENGENPPILDDLYTITTTVDANGTGQGTISPVNPSVYAGEDSTISFIPGEKSHVAKVVVTENGQTKTLDGMPSGYTFTNVQGPCSVVVTFDKDAPVDDDLYYTVSISSDENGDLYPQGENIQVPRGEALVVYVYPNDGYVLDKFVMDGKGVVSENARALVAPVAELETAQSGAESGAVTYAAGPESRASNPPAGYAEVHSFKVEGDGTLSAAFKQKSTVATQMHTVVATAGDHGKITPSGAVEVPDGGDMTFAFTPDTGYEVASVTVNGTKHNGAVTSYTLKDVKDDGTIHVDFRTKTAAGAQDPVARVLRTMQSLAATGDLQGPAIVALLTVACGALGAAILLSGRRRKATSDSE